MVSRRLTRPQFTARRPCWALATALLFAAACGFPSVRQSVTPAATVLAASQPTASAGNATTPPQAENSIRFLVLGDTGTGERAQYDVAQQMVKSRATNPPEDEASSKPSCAKRSRASRIGVLEIDSLATSESSESRSPG